MCRWNAKFDKRVLHKLDQVINGGIGDLAQLVERYSRLALSGGFSARVDKAVKLLEQHYMVLKKHRVDQDQLQRVEVSLDLMRKKLELLNNAKENVRKEIKSVGMRSEAKEWFRL